jgi:tetratricopeptide (TPR) repeat protein
MRGLAYYKQGQYAQAIIEYDQAIQFDPTFEFADAYLNRGNAYFALRQFSRAIIDYDKSIQINATNGLAYLNRGLAYQRLGKQKEADADFVKYKELGGQSPTISPTP